MVSRIPLPQCSTDQEDTYIRIQVSAAAKIVFFLVAAAVKTNMKEIPYSQALVHTYWKMRTRNVENYSTNFHYSLKNGSLRSMCGDEE
jgi:hypothetical protein